MYVYTYTYMYISVYTYGHVHVFTYAHAEDIGPLDGSTPGVPDRCKQSVSPIAVVSTAEHDCAHT